jgi:CHAT domain-containing protein
VRLVGHAPERPETIRALLRPDEALLKLLPTPVGTFVFLVTANDARVHHASLTATQLQRLVRRVRASVDASVGTVPVFDVAAAHQLYRDLLAPLREHLAGIRHLIAVPSGPLLGLPLGLLVTRPVPDVSRDDDYRTVAWLARDVAISVLPSVTALRDLRTVVRPSAAPRPFLGFGNPAFAGGTATLRAAAISQQGCRGDQGWDRDALRALAPLPETVDELRAMAQALGGGNDDVVLGGDATEARVRRTDLQQYRVLAFATHGLLPGEVRCQGEPALALTPGGTDARSDDGLLEVSEVAALKLDAEWVVLSACHTGSADGNGGESLSGLTRAFFYAGARSVLASLWAVASHPTVTLTTGTVTLKAREPALGRAEALRRSAMSLAADAATSHPFFWAPFILVGDGGS